MGVQRIRYKDRQFAVTVKKSGEWFEVTVDGTHLCASVERGVAHLAADEARWSAVSAVADNRVFVELDGRLFDCERVTDDGAGGADHGHAGEKDKAYAPMPGKIVKISVSVGDAVTAKQPLAVVESMKMENVIVSAAAGVVKKINFAAGDQVDTERAIVELELG
ncbi:MAG TPA: biotin/lipoyl-containing protein, partial [candidate division Zixibacteria bacterium]|nr:biotin/lipoyl-containing protein [candidate division Zixibacteria bacterium]